jgi:uncharacterized metal-binding protein YceD (DUF177 family)
MQPGPAPEFSFPIEIAQIPPAGAHYTIAASPSERARVAARLGVTSIGRLEATVDVKPGAGGVIRVAGRIGADLVQSCVVSLAPVPATIDEQIEASFVEEGRHDQRRDAEDVALDDEEPPEIVQDGRIDLGELTVAQLALVLDPYPRAPGVSFDATQWSAPAGKDSPFAALAALKKRKQT